MTSKISKRGIVISDVPNVAITLIITAAVFVAGFLVVTGLQDTQVTGVTDCNSTNRTGCSDAYYAAGNLSAGMTAIVNYAPTWGTILGVAVLYRTNKSLPREVGIVLAGFGFAKTKGYL